MVWKLTAHVSDGTRFDSWQD